METFCGVRCQLQRAGQGDGVILLHGWGQDMRMMRLVQNELRAHYRVVNLDLPGFGESDEPSAPTTAPPIGPSIEAAIKISASPKFIYPNPTGI